MCCIKGHPSGWPFSLRAACRSVTTVGDAHGRVVSGAMCAGFGRFGVEAALHR